MNMPTEVPILSARDFCRGSYGIDGVHCLGGWRMTIFRAEAGEQVVVSASNAIHRAIKETGRTYYGRIPLFNDNPKHPKTLLARVWNRAMYLLGYTEGNPESKPLRRRKSC